jgi:hypothetical protein
MCGVEGVVLYIWIGKRVLNLTSRKYLLNLYNVTPPRGGLTRLPNAGATKPDRPHGSSTCRAWRESSGRGLSPEVERQYASRAHHNVSF